MKALGDTLQAMKLPEDSAKEPPRGLTTTAGHSITVRRERALTLEQLTEIALRLLTKPPRLTLTEMTKYGRKSIEGAIYENEPIGSEIVVVAELDFLPDCPANMLNAAMAISPRSAVTNHITRLAAHKKFFGSSEKDRPLLLADYATALESFPEFVIFSVCRHYWENDRRPFVPFIDELREACEAMVRALDDRRNPKIEKQERPKMAAMREEETPHGKDARRALCIFLVEKGEPDYFNQIRLMSNYDLERFAASKYGWKNPNERSEAGS